MKRLFLHFGLTAVVMATVFAGLGIYLFEREVRLARQIHALDQTRSVLDNAERIMVELLYKGAYYSDLHVSAEMLSLRRGLDMQVAGLVTIDGALNGTLHTTAQTLSELSFELGELAGIRGSADFGSRADVLVHQSFPAIHLQIDNSLTPLRAGQDSIRQQLYWVQISIPVSLLVFLLVIWTYLVRPAEHRQMVAQRRLEMKRAEAEALADRANMAADAKMRFLSTMSHELRTPLNGVIGLSDSLQTMVKGKEARETLSAIRASGESLVFLINDILDFSKLQAGKMTLEQMPVDLRVVCDPLGMTYRTMAHEKGISFNVEIQPDTPVNRIADPHRLGQVLHNLIGNAIKFTQSGTVTLRIESFEAQPLRIYVKDTGIGMTEQQASTVFQDFVQADSTITRKFGGTGLGMSIVKHLVDAMDGGIAVNSVLGKGTEFTLTLPLVETTLEDRRKTKRLEAPKLPKGLRILAADDNRTNRLVLEKLLKPFEVALEIYDGGAPAVSAAAQRDFDLILLDIQMPDLDGIAALKQMQQRSKSQGRRLPPALAVTANSMTQQIASYKAAGFDGTVTKPFKSAEIAIAIARALAEHGRQQAAVLAAKPEKRTRKISNG